MNLTIFHRPEYRHSWVIDGGAVDIVTAAACLDLGAISFDSSSVRHPGHVVFFDA